MATPAEPESPDAPAEPGGLGRTLALVRQMVTRFWYVLAACVAAAHAVGFVALQTRTRYLASAKLLIQTPENNVLQAVSRDLTSLSRANGRTGDDLGEKLQLYLNTHEFQLRGAEALTKAPGYPAVERYVLALNAGRFAGLGTVAVPAAALTLNDLALVIARTVAFRSSGDESLEVQASEPDAAVAATIANVVAQAAVDEATARELREADQSWAYVTKKVSEIWDHLRSVNDRLLRLRLNSPLPARLAADDLARRTGRLTAEIEAAAIKMASNEALLTRYGADVGRLGGAVADRPAPDADDLALLRTQLDVLRAKHRALLTEGDASGSQAVQDVAADIAATLVQLKTLRAALPGRAPRTGLLDRRRAAMRRLSEENGQLRALTRANKEVLAQLTNATRAQPGAEQSASELVRLVELEFSLYAELRREEFRLEVQRITVQNKVSVLEWARPELASRLPSHRGVLVLATVLGLGAGLAAAFVLDLRSPRITGHVDVQDLGARILGQIPDLQRLPGRPGRPPRRAGGGWGAAGDAAGARSLLFGQLRAKLSHMRLTPGSGGRIVSVHSALSGDGKSFISYYLTTALVQAGRRCLLVDGDVVRGTLSARLGLADRPGLADCLAATASLDAAIVAYAGPLFAVLACGTPGPGRAKALQSEGLAQLLATLQARYDYVVIDTAPVLPVPDAVNIARHADVVLVSVTCRKSLLHDLADTVDRLREASRAPVCLVLNKATGIKVGRFASYYDRRQNDGKASGPAASPAAATAAGAGGGADRGVG